MLLGPRLQCFMYYAPLSPLTIFDFTFLSCILPYNLLFLSLRYSLGLNSTLTLTIQKLWTWTRIVDVRILGPFTKVHVFSSLPVPIVQPQVLLHPQRKY